MVDIWSTPLLLIYWKHNMLESTNKGENDEIDPFKLAEEVMLAHATRERDKYVEKLKRFAGPSDYEAVLNCACPLTLKFIHWLIVDYEDASTRLSGISDALHRLATGIDQQHDLW